MIVSNNGVSKFLAYLLRHRPQSLGLNMDSHGWVEVDEMISKINNNKKYDVPDITFEDIKEVVKTNKKQRFILKYENGKCYIRANQGHTLKNVDLEFEEKEPPKVLYHGTGKKYINSIFDRGIIKKTRQYVHLSSDIKIAYEVGIRHGEVVILEIDAEQMYRDGVKFYLSANNVWLVDFVDKRYFKIIDYK